MLEIEHTGHRGRMITRSACQMSLKPKNLRRQYLENQARYSAIVTTKRE